MSAHELHIAYGDAIAQRLAADGLFAHPYREALVVGPLAARSDLAASSKNAVSRRVEFLTTCLAGDAQSVRSEIQAIHDDVSDYAGELVLHVDAHPCLDCLLFVLTMACLAGNASGLRVEGHLAYSQPAGSLAVGEPASGFAVSLNDEWVRAAHLAYDAAALRDGDELRKAAGDAHGSQLPWWQNALQLRARQVDGHLDEALLRIAHESARLTGRAAPSFADHWAAWQQADPGFGFSDRVYWSLLVELALAKPHLLACKPRCDVTDISDRITANSYTSVTFLPVGQTTEAAPQSSSLSAR